MITRATNRYTESPRSSGKAPRPDRLEALTRWLCVPLTAILTLGFTLPSYGDIINVGSGGSGAGCEASTLSQAIVLARDSPGPDEIRLARNLSYTENNVLTGILIADPVTISGGWDSCTDPTPSGQTSLSGTGTASAIVVTSGISVILERLIIDGAGAITLDAGLGGSVDLVGTEINGGTTGIRVNSGATASLDFDSLITGNTSTTEDLGGGITCGLIDAANSGGTVNINGVVTQNSAPRGGGVLGRWGNCRIILGEGAWIQNNEADLGGGVYLEEGAFMGGGGTGSSGTTISLNRADRGGGIYVTDVDTRASLFNTRIDNNEAQFTGGGVDVRAEGFFSLNRSPVNSCPAPPRCATINTNRIMFPGENEGSAINVRENGRAELYRVYVEGNRGFAEAGQVLHVEDDATSLFIHSVQIWNNFTQAILSASGSATLYASYISAARNRWRESGDVFRNSFGASASMGADISLGASILTDTQGFSGLVAGRCLIVDDDNNLTSVNTMVGVDPRFSNPASGDLHLQSASLAIDYCDDISSPIGPDMDLHGRGFDAPLLANELGAYDLGMDEKINVAVLFADGFESGDTSAWSATVP